MPNAQWFLPEVGALGGEEALPGSCCAMHITLRFLTAFGELYASLCFGVREGKKESPLFERRHCGRSDWASLVIWWCVWWFLRTLRINYPIKSFRESPTRKEENRLSFLVGGVFGDSDWHFWNSSRWWYFSLPNKCLGEGKAQATLWGPPTENGPTVKNHSQGSPASVSSVLLNLGVSSAHSWTGARPRVREKLYWFA